MSDETKVLAYTLGADLGQSQDYTAVALIEQVIGKRGFEWNGYRYEEFEREFSKEEFIYNVVGAKRLPLGTPYPEQVKDIGKILNDLPVAGKGLTRHGHQARRQLAVDRTGVGRPVVDLFEEAGLNPIGITITGGDQVVQDGNHYRVPKRELINQTKVLLQQGRLKISSQAPDYRILVAEMQNFTYKINDNANDVYGREGQHDDMLLALCIGLWVAEKQFENELRFLGPGDEAYDALVEWERSGYGLT